MASSPYQGLDDIERNAISLAESAKSPEVKQLAEMIAKLCEIVDDVDTKAGESEEQAEEIRKSIREAK